MFKKILFVTTLAAFSVGLAAQNTTKKSAKPLVESIDTFQRSTPTQIRATFQTIDSLYQKETKPAGKIQLMQELYDALSQDFIFEGAEQPTNKWQDQLYQILEDHAKPMQMAKSQAARLKQTEQFRQTLRNFLFPPQA